MSSLTCWWQTVLARPSGDFLVTPGARYSRAALAAAVRQACGLWRLRGLAEGERVVIVSGDDFAAISLHLGALLHGLVPVLLQADTPGARAVAIARDTGAALLLADEGLAEGWDCPCPALSITRPPARRWRRAQVGWSIAGHDPAPEDPALPEDLDAPAYLLFTSGTTQTPTGVVLTRGNVLANLATIARVLEVGPESRLFNDMILSHADGLVQGPLLASFTGAALVRAGGFALGQLEHWLDTVQREGCSHFLTVPTVWSMIDRHAAHDDYFAAPRMQYLVSCAAFLDPELWVRIESRFRCKLLNEYGLTETVTSALYAGGGPETGPRASLGRPVDCEARAAPLDGLDPGAGELQLRGANIFPGYWRNPVRTAESFTGDGWFRTGDIVRARDDGAFDYLGRLKTVILSGGLLIRPEEVDEAMLRHPQVTASATVGLPDADFGEITATAVEVTGEVSEVELAAHAARWLERLKQPRLIVVMEQIPRGLSGKVRTRDLVAELAARRAAALPAGTGTRQARILALAAGVFRCAPEALTLRSGTGDVAGWDSFTHMNLLLAAEEAFDIRIPVRHAADIRCLADLARAVAASGG